MIRKLILLALGYVVVKKLYENSNSSEMRAPFPTTSRPPEGWQPEV